MATKTKEALSQEMINGLRSEYGLRYLGKLDDGAHYFRTSLAIGGPDPYVMWFIADNGGEFNIGPVNYDESSMRSIPYTAHMRTLSARTMVYRLGQVFRGEEIDWSVEYPE